MYLRVWSSMFAALLVLVSNKTLTPCSNSFDNQMNPTPGSDPLFGSQA
jgi:hypothetical protein